MRGKINWQVLTLSISLAAGVAAGDISNSSAENGYRSPYAVAFTIDPAQLAQPNQAPPRNDWHEESSTAYDHWYSQHTRHKYGAWGPEPRHYPAIAGIESLSPAWKIQRVLFVATSMIGLPYQHHHIPDWDPPRDWPWKRVAYGCNSKGMDCSDFTSWVYNYGLGIKLKTGIGQQADTADIPGPGGEGTIQAQTIFGDGGYESLVNKLRSGDLLYIKNNGGKISHVIMWVGEYGRSPDGTPLVIDCTGPEHKDANGNQIPIGVQLRPFTRDSWYYRSFAHAHRLIY